jgi:hypothetical protein
MRLVGINGPLAGATYILAPGLTINGTDAASALPCRIRVAASENAFRLESPNDSDAVFVNGLPLTRRPLKAGDEVRLGDSLLIARPTSRPRRRLSNAVPSRLADSNASATSSKLDSKKRSFTRNTARNPMAPAVSSG